MRRLLSGLMRLKHLGVRLITCGLIEGRLNFPYNNSAIMPPSMVSYCFLSERVFHSGLCMRAVQRASGNFTDITLRRLYNAKDINKGPERRKQMRRKARPCNPRRSCRVFGSRSKRERPVTNASS